MVRAPFPLPLLLKKRHRSLTTTQETGSLTAGKVRRKHGGIGRDVQAPQTLAEREWAAPSPRNAHVVELAALVEPVTLGILNDTIPEGTETFSLAIASVVGNALVGNKSFTTVTINDVDSASIPVYIGSFYQQIAENGTQIAAPVTLQSTPSTNVTVQFDT